MVDYTCSIQANPMLQLLDVDQFMHKIYMEFLGSSTYLKDQAREEFFKLKCCSFNQKHLEQHFKKVRARFYILIRVDDPNLKQVYLN